MESRIFWGMERRISVATKPGHGSRLYLAKAAGLIAKPEKASCTAKCHKAAEFKDEMLTKVHDKKAAK